MEKLRKLVTRLNKFASQNSKRLFFLVPLISILLCAALVYSFKSVFVVALVNNQPLSRFALDRELEKQDGGNTLENMIIKTLILQEAKEKGIVVGAQETQQKIADIEKQVSSSGQSLDEILASRGQTRQDLEEQIKIQLVIEKILGGEVKVSDEEINDYFQKNKNALPKDATLESQKEEIKETLFNQKMSEAFQNWTEKLKTEAKIIYFLQI